MSKYSAFLAIFLISVVATIIFLIYNLQGIMELVSNAPRYEQQEPPPAEVIGTIFNPPMVISGIILLITSLVYRIMGIVYVARNKEVKDGEKALWIVGFVFMGFITAIVFLILAKGKKFTE